MAVEMSIQEYIRERSDRDGFRRQPCLSISQR